MKKSQFLDKRKSNDDGREKYFNEWDPDLYGDNLWFYHVINIFSKGIIHGRTLDLGCGSRIYYDVTNVSKWVGIDLSEAALTNIRFVGGNPPQQIETHRINCEFVDFNEQSFDTIVAFFIFHHLGRVSKYKSGQAVYKLMRKTWRMLRPGGILFVAENVPKFPMRPYQFAYRPLYWLARRHFNIELPYFWTIGEFLSIARKAGYIDAVLMQIPIKDRIKNPVLGFAFPASLAELFQRMTLYILHR